MIGHTPGPWVVVGKTEIGVALDTPEARVIADTQLHYGPVTEEMIANARLIAAAPDMLAACEGLVDMLGRDYDADAFAVAYLAAQLSIAKARGEVQL